MVSGFRRIGVLKSVGFTPDQIVLMHLSIALVPAAVGGLIGAVAGWFVGSSIVTNTLEEFGASTAQVAVWVPIAVLAAALVTVGLAALVPSVRARRLSASQALTAGANARAPRALRIQRELSSWRVPRSVSLGLGLPFARPARSALTAASIVTGIAAVTLAVGTTGSVVAFREAASPDYEGRYLVTAGDPVETGPRSSYGAPPLTDPQLEKNLASIPGVQQVSGALQTDVALVGVSNDALVRFYRSAAMMPPTTVGHRAEAADEAVASTKFLTRNGLEVGDELTIEYAGSRVSVTLVGVTLVTSTGELALGWDTLTALDPDAAPSEYQVQLDDAQGEAAFTDAVHAADGSLFVQPPRINRSSQAAAIVASAVALTVVLALVSALGVFNTVLLTVNERRRDIGMLKSIGTTPRQVISMMVTSTALIGLIGGVLGVPLGMAVHRYLVPRVAQGSMGEALEVMLAVYSWPVVVLLAVSGVALGVLGALLPARSAARTPIATVLHNE